MAFFLDTQETTQRFGNLTAEFRQLLDTDHLKHGSPDDLFEFAKTLERNNQFRMDLSTLVKSVMKKEGELLLTDMMSIIATAVGGESVAETHTDITGPTKTLMEFLLGTGCWRYFGSSSRPVGQSAEPPLRTTVRTEDSSSMRISLPVTPISTISESTEDRASLLEISKELRQTLARLESNTQQVKLHLDSIEKQINKIESASEAPPVQALSGLEPLLHRGATNPAPAKVVQPVDEVTPIFATKPAAPARAVFSQLADPDQDDDFTAPTFAYGTEKRKSIIPVTIFLVLVAIGIAIFLFLHSGHGATLLKDEMSRLKGDHPNVSAPAPPATTPSSTTQPPTSATSTTTSSSPTQPQPTTPETVAGSTVAQSTAPNAANPNASPDEEPALAGSSFRYIPANVMEGYLLSAPRPEYPPQARMNHVEGQVVLQATISKSGSVMALHAIKGSQLLRSAAVDAVRTWRYKPYSVDGQPRDVSTTVYVDFTLAPPPAIVH